MNKEQEINRIMCRLDNIKYDVSFKGELVRNKLINKMSRAVETYDTTVDIQARNVIRPKSDKGELVTFKTPDGRVMVTTKEYINKIQDEARARLGWDKMSLMVERIKNE